VPSATPFTHIHTVILIIRQTRTAHTPRTLSPLSRLKRNSNSISALANNLLLRANAGREAAPLALTSHPLAAVDPAQTLAHDAGQLEGQLETLLSLSER